MLENQQEANLPGKNQENVSNREKGLQTLRDIQKIKRQEVGEEIGSLTKKASHMAESNLLDSLMERKISLRKLLNLCPSFKEKVFSQLRKDMKNSDEEEPTMSECWIAQPQEAARIRDDNVARINFAIRKNEMK
ncbi:hypothetical protein GOP47_0022020 [Adiantum capillus-veneris]|uniref:Uncharacterized protein n=1 Tax=Adiantum capillus-veneris TaxID=13818 RepID=A0A9D4Z5S0_ADICA|nr:hypothetical protein GOP47_0022020 [Adiantum capillus-veneris]